jgi:hypothetical protein
MQQAYFPEQKRIETSMEKLFKRGISKTLRYALCLTIIPLSSPVAVQGFLSVMPIPSQVGVPLVVTFLTLAYAWCIWEIKNSPNTAQPSNDEAYDVELPAQPSGAG